MMLRKVTFTSLNNTYMQLRKVCNHPYLFLDDEELSTLVVSEVISFLLLIPDHLGNRSCFWKV